MIGTFRYAFPLAYTSNEHRKFLEKKKKENTEILE